MSKLSFEFYNRHVVEVAKDLLGKELHFGEYSGIITETEAYRGSDDEASHAYKGTSPRSRVMFGPVGYSYIYFIYGMYYCLNIVTEEENNPSAVLIRAITLTSTHLIPYPELNQTGEFKGYLAQRSDVREHRPSYSKNSSGSFNSGRGINGPGKICRYFGITKEHNNIDITSSPNFYLTSGIKVPQYQATPRIGIRKATDKLWRFVVSDLSM